MHALLVNGAVGADKLKKRNMRLLTLQHFHARKGVAAILLLLLAFSLCNSLVLPCRQPDGALVDDERSAAAWRRFGMKCSGPSACRWRCIYRLRSRAVALEAWRFFVSILSSLMTPARGNLNSEPSHATAGWRTQGRRFNTLGLHPGHLTRWFGNHTCTCVQDHAVCISL
jgi:hypothetical protein